MWPNSDSTTDGSLIQFVHFVKLKSAKPIHANALAKNAQFLFNQQIQSGLANRRFRHFTEIETGDCVIEYSPEIRLEGRQELRFVIEGIEWSAKPMSQDLREV